ncbi:MAG: NifB/NifX family molybdenum-iron cluster-binding protein [Thermoplasmatales archaeon]
MRIVIPVLENRGESSRVSQHFGRAPFLAIVEISEGKILKLDFVNGEGPHEEHRGEEDRGRATSIHGRIIQIKPDAIVASMIGPRAVEDFTRAGIKILQVEGETLSEVVSMIEA